MRVADINIRETNISGKGVLQSGVYGTECPALLDRGILGVGHARIVGPYQIVRLNPDFEHLTYCFQGAGSALIRGKWVPFSKGNVVLSPRAVPHGAASNHRKPGMWGLTWIIFNGKRSKRQRLQVKEATLTESGYPSPLTLVEGLEREVTCGGDKETIHLWVALIDRWVERLLIRKSEDERLWNLWEKVQQNLASSWSLAEMAHEASLSEGHLRRLCRTKMGLSPRQQLTRLRMRKVSVLLATTNLSLQEISEEVGYSDPFALSNAFHRITGSSPRDFRKSLRGCNLSPNDWTGREENSPINL